MILDSKDSAKDKKIIQIDEIREVDSERKYLNFTNKRPSAYSMRDCSNSLKTSI